MNPTYLCVLAAVVLFAMIPSSDCAAVLQKRAWADGDDVFRMTEGALGGKLSQLLTRPRRNVAQWYIGSHHFNDYNHDRPSRRRNHRRPNHHHHGGGQIVDA